MVSKPPVSEMSIQDDLTLPLNVRTDIVEVINNIFKIKYIINNAKIEKVKNLKFFF